MEVSTPPPRHRNPAKLSESPNDRFMSFAFSLPEYTMSVAAVHGILSPEGEAPMPLWRPDPTFYPSPRIAMQAPAERLAYVAMLNAHHNGRPDALGVVDVEPG